MTLKDRLKDRLKAIKNIKPTLGLSKKAEYLKELLKKRKKKK